MKSVLTAMLMAAALTPAAAFAANFDDSPAAVPVHYGDLDLGRTSDARVMLRRIRTAALEACGASTVSLPDYRYAVQKSSCFHDGVAQAVSELNAPALTGLYTRRAGVVSVQ